jgi:hypothetical protein
MVYKKIDSGIAFSIYSLAHSLRRVTKTTQKISRHCWVASPNKHFSGGAWSIINPEQADGGFSSRTENVKLILGMKLVSFLLMQVGTVTCHCSDLSWQIMKIILSEI